MTCWYGNASPVLDAKNAESSRCGIGRVQRRFRKANEFGSEPWAERNQAGLEELGVSDRKDTTMKVCVPQRQTQRFADLHPRAVESEKQQLKSEQLQGITAGLQDAGSAQ